jgi:hypothetical protein
VKTAIEVGKDGNRTIFHRRGEMAWTHPEGERYSYVGTTGERVDVGCDSPVARPTREADHGRIGVTTPTTARCGGRLAPTATATA